MFCSSCGQLCESTNRFCPHCGASIAPPPKKGRFWPAIIALAVVFALGLGIFLLFPPAESLHYDPTMPWFSVSEGVLYFNEYAYTGSSTLTVPSAINGQTITAISDSCFYDCDSLVAIHLPSTVTYIGPDAFADCDSLRGIRLPDALTTLDSGAFYGCSKLEAVVVPATLTYTGEDIFTDCDSLTSLFYSGTLESWKKLNFYGIPAGAILSCTDGLYTLN